MARKKDRHHPDAAYEGGRKRSKPNNVSGNGEASRRMVTRKPASRKPLEQATIKAGIEDEDSSSSSSEGNNVTGNGEDSRRTVTRKPAPRKPLKQATIKDNIEDEDSSSSSSGDNGPETPGPKSSPENGSRKRKSILQPKGSKYSKKAAKRRGKIPANDEADTSDSSYEAIEKDSSPLAAAAHRDMSTLANSTQVQPKRQHHSSVLDDYASYHTYLPRPEKKKIYVGYTMPSSKPQGPGDIWTCTWENCNKRVHAGSTDEGQAEIEGHFKGHKSSAEEKIQLAMAESRPYLPVT